LTFRQQLLKTRDVFIYGRQSAAIQTPIAQADDLGDDLKTHATPLFDCRKVISQDGVYRAQRGDGPVPFMTYVIDEVLLNLVKQQTQHVFFTSEVTVYGGLRYANLPGDAAHSDMLCAALDYQVSDGVHNLLSPYGGGHVFLDHKGGSL
jgi:hypothetical protein